MSTESTTTFGGPLRIEGALVEIVTTGLSDVEFQINDGTTIRRINMDARRIRAVVTEEGIMLSDSDPVPKRSRADIQGEVETMLYEAAQSEDPKLQHRTVLQLADSLDVSTAQVRTALKKLIELNIVIELPRGRSNEPMRYRWQAS